MYFSIPGQLTNLNHFVKKSQTKPLIGDWNGFYNTIEDIENSNAPVLSKFPLEFEFNFDAAAHNSNLLEAVK